MEWRRRSADPSGRRNQERDNLLGCSDRFGGFLPAGGGNGEQRNPHGNQHHQKGDLVSGGAPHAPFHALLSLLVFAFRGLFLAPDFAGLRPGGGMVGRHGVGLERNQQLPGPGQLVLIDDPDLNAFGRFQEVRLDAFGQKDVGQERCLRGW